jgi:hypothetical protein
LKNIVNSADPKLNNISTAMPKQAYQGWYEAVETNTESRTDYCDTSAMAPCNDGVTHSPILLRNEECKDKEPCYKTMLIYGSNKGGITAGQPVFSSLTGHPGYDYFASPEIRDEAVGTGTGAVALYAPTLAYTPVVRNTVQFTDGTQVVRDDGRGFLVGDVDPTGVNTIVYATGVCSFTFTANVAAGIAVTANYEYENEANQTVPEIDFQLTSSPVAAKIFKLRTRYSLEAAQNLRSLHGLSAETELVTGLAQELRFEIDRSIIKDVNSFAQATAVTWPLTPPGGIGWTEHKLSLVDVFIQGSNNIFELTRRGQPNWIIMGLRVSNVVESLPGFKPSPDMSTPTGVIPAGVLNGHWKIAAKAA